MFCYNDWVLFLSVVNLMLYNLLKIKMKLFWHEICFIYWQRRYRYV